MSLISFLKEAGEKLLNRGSGTQDAGAQAADPGQNDLASAKAMERAILDYMAQQGLPIQTITVAYDVGSATVNVTGSAPDHSTREKLILCAGNVNGVEHVNDQINVTASNGAAGQESEWYTVKSGDSLSKIAAQFYGNANEYNTIFEANQPMLRDPDQIYPGQTLRIPRQA